MVAVVVVVVMGVGVLVVVGVAVHVVVIVVFIPMMMIRPGSSLLLAVHIDAHECAGDSFSRASLRLIADFRQAECSLSP